MVSQAIPKPGRTDTPFSTIWSKELEYSPKDSPEDLCYKWCINAVVGVPGQVIGAALDEIFAIGTSIQAVATWGSNPIVLVNSIRYTSSAGCIVSHLYQRTMNIILPWAQFKDPETKIFRPWVGGAAMNFAQASKEKVAGLINSKSWCNRHITARLAIASISLAKLILRVVDFAVGVIAAIVSVACLGLFAEANMIATRGLGSIGQTVTSDLYKGIMNFIDPKFFIRATETLPNQTIKTFLKANQL